MRHRSSPKSSLTGPKFENVECSFNFPTFRLIQKSFSSILTRGFWREFQPRIAPVNILEFLKVSLLASKFFYNNPLRNRRKNYWPTRCSNIDWVGVILLQKWSKETLKEWVPSDSTTIDKQIPTNIQLTLVNALIEKRIMQWNTNSIAWASVRCRSRLQVRLESSPRYFGSQNLQDSIWYRTSE